MPATAFDTHAVNGKTLHHRALADPSRVRVLECLRASEGALSVARLAAEVGLHQNTIRAHLAVLEDASLVVVRSENGGRPGRPRLLFTAVPDEAEAEHVWRGALPAWRALRRTSRFWT